MNIILAALLILIPSASASQNACDYAILSKGFVYYDNYNGPSQIDGNVGSSSTTYVFPGSWMPYPSVSKYDAFSESRIVNGRMYSANHKSPTPSNLEKLVVGMEGLSLNLFNEPVEHSDTSSIAVLEPGKYMWTNGFTISDSRGGTGEITFDGGGNTAPVWIMEIVGDLTIDIWAKILLVHGAKAENIFWVVHGHIRVNAYAHVEGIMTSQKTVTFRSGSSLNGAIYAKQGVNLYSNIEIKTVGLGNVGECPTPTPAPTTET